MSHLILWNLISCLVLSCQNDTNYVKVKERLPTAMHDLSFVLLVLFCLVLLSSRPVLSCACLVLPCLGKLLSCLVVDVLSCFVLYGLVLESDACLHC